MAGRRHRLTAARKAAGLTIEEFAFAVDVAVSTAKRWESGRNEPQPHQRPRIAKVLGRLRDEVAEILRIDDPERSGVSPGGGLRLDVLGTGGDVDGRIGYVLRNPRSVDLVVVAELRERIRALDVAYESTPSSLLVGEAGQCLGNVMLFKGYASPRVSRELLVAEAEAALLVGQLVWDASQRREHTAARLYFEQAKVAARQRGDQAGEGMALLRESIVALYGEHDPKAGLDLALQASGVGGAASSVVAGLGMLHAAEAYGMLGRRRLCEQALKDAETRLEQFDGSDPAAELYSPTQPGRLSGAAYLALGDARRAQGILERTASDFATPSKNEAIVLGNLGLALVHQREIDDAATVLNQAIDAVEATRGGGGLNIVFEAGRQLRPWRDLPAVRDLDDRLLTLMTAA